ncbi:multidrug resistance-associated ABC transporter [Lentinula detonsa]|uniref:Multidrug resistance-associated ABC transporter n=1 Tax=Lentinula detonsa TaxID=2804962 RepID=A0A9W8U0C2_9AGAR|nr:multidrug resistance-associated ABC transporter [Lentinula detonsa]
MQLSISHIGTIWFAGGTAGAISAVSLLLHTALRYGAKLRPSETYAPIHHSPVFRYRVLRILACLVFTALTFASFTRSTIPKIERVVTSVSVLYLVWLSLASTFCGSRLSPMSNILNRHLNILLLILFGVYIYRDLWALLKFNGKPLDHDEGNILWFKIASLAIAAILVPIAAPRQEYPPTSDTAITLEINPEETASILSLLTHSYMDSFIFRKNRKAIRLAQDELPPLAKADQSDVLMPDILSILDPPSASSRYLLWGLLEAYKKRVLALIGLHLLQIPLSFVAPTGIKKVLSYLEKGGEGATIRPWVWISWLFFGPTLKAVLFQLFTYIATRNDVQIKAVLNQLLLQHSLRIRIDSVNLSGKQQKDNFTGKLINLAASDATEVSGLADVWIVLLCFPVEFGLSLWFLYDILEWSVFIGYAFMLLCIPLPFYISQLIRKIQITRKQKTDARVQSVTEALSVIRMVKLFGWETRLRAQIAEKRDDELSFARKSKLFDVLNAHVNFTIPMLTMMITYAFYTAYLKKELTASAVFSSMAVFEMLRARIRQVAVNILPLIQGKVALDRLDNFLRKTELLDHFDQHHTSAPPDLSMIGFRNSEFRWLGSGNHNFKLKFEGEVLFRPNGINLIVGPTGAGKTSILLALLGEMRFTSIESDSYYNLPREGGVSYAAQESWIQNDTIRNNVLFGSDFNEERYNDVLYQCGLLRDLSLFDAGDMTEVGEKGINLSGGQKARVTLARAVYSSAQTVLLDDPLSALDVHTAKWVVDKCFNGELIRGRTVLLVTHNIALVSPLAHHVVAITSEGRITQGTVTDVILNDTVLAAQVIEGEKGLQLYPEHLKREEETLTLPADKQPRAQRGALILAEEMEVGHVGWEAFKLYINGLNKYPVAFFWLVITLVFLSGSISAMQSWFMGYWASQYETQPASSVSVSWFLSVYATLLVLSLTTYSSGFALWIFGSIRAGQIIHRRFIDSIVASTFRWLDVTPTSRIMTRATADIRSIDDLFSAGIWQLTEASLRMFIHLGSIMIFAPLFLLPGVAIAFLGGYFGQVYLSARLPLRRLMSINRAPILGNFTAAVAGLVSIRAFGAEEMFLRESRLRIDTWFRPTIPSYNTNRWIGIRVDVLAGIFTAALGAYLVYGNSGTSAANTGFSVTMAVNFTALSLAWVRLYNAAEIEANSLERMKRYLDIEHEEEATSEGIPPAYWPASGTLHVEGLCARYSANGPEVLHNLTFSVRSGEHIGIVGRTGSGKSSLTLALLRAIPISGEVFYDGISTTKLNLHTLRSNITITPQVPELLTGTLRSNLDPFSEHDDSRLNDALRSAGLFALQGEGPNGLTLDSEIRGGGSSNLSVGQRQIIALARAIVRKSKLLIFDEADPRIDHRTDSIIQETLRHELGGDVTLITVAHRLATVMDYDRIMVLDEGRIVEFDSPRQLLEKEGGMFRGLVDESADRTELYRMII